MCTSVLTGYPGGLVMGRNMDYDVPIDYNILYFPEGYTYAKDLMGNKMRTKYRMTGLCFNNFNPLKDGINEHGLAGCTNLFIGMDRYSSKIEEGKLNISALDYFSYALGSYRDIDELIAGLKDIHISYRNLEGKRIICPDFHYYFMDRNGKSAVIEPLGKKLTAIKNPYGVMTNSPEFTSHERRLLAFKEKGKVNPARNLPGGFDPVSRFIRAYYLKSGTAKSSVLALENTFSVLEALKLPENFAATERDNIYTRYTCAYDTGDTSLYVRTHRNPHVYKIKLSDFYSENDRVSITLPDEFTSQTISPKELNS